jgi:hypothetical protein
MNISPMEKSQQGISVIATVLITAIATFGIGAVLIYGWQQIQPQQSSNNGQGEDTQDEDQSANTINDSGRPTSGTQVDPTTDISADIRTQADVIVAALEVKDMNKIANAADPVRGVRFSPYGYIDPVRDIILLPDQIRTAFDDESIYTWGFEDGTGDPIQMTFSQYYDRYVYDRPFANADQTSVNRLIGTGNTINNIAEVYPNGAFVEYYMVGDEQFAGLDWKSLRLVFEQQNNALVLVGIVHDQWTI